MRSICVAWLEDSLADIVFETLLKIKRRDCDAAAAAAAAAAAGKRLIRSS